MEDQDDSVVPQPTKKRPLEGGVQGGKKTKRKKKEKKDEGLPTLLEQAAVMGETPTLFTMQVQELLKASRMKKKRAEKLQDAVDSLKEFLVNLSPGKEHKLSASNRAWLKEVRLPVEEVRPTKGCFRFLPPARVHLGGSTPLHTCVTPGQPADLVLEMPKDCFQAKDWLNHRYVRKRAMYLSAVAVALRKSSLVEEMNFTYHQGNIYRPVLVLSVPVEGKGKALMVHVHAVPEEGTFKMNRFHITKNNVRPRWFLAQDQEEEDGNDEGGSLPSTPVYNSSILQDICYHANAHFLSRRLKDVPQIQDAIAALKIWAHQRELDVGFGGLSGLLLSLYVCHLMDAGKVQTSMHCAQVMGTVLLHLSESRWLENPVVLCKDELGKGGRPTLDQFLQEFDVVFVDVTGFLNLALGMSKGLYRRVCQEAEVSARCLAQEQFDAIFMTPCAFHLKFDLTFTVSLGGDALSRVVEKLQLSDQVLDNGGPAVDLVIPRLLDLLEQGLGDRILLLQTLPVSSPVWLVNEAPPPRATEFKLGLLLHDSHSLRLVDRGPAANAPEALDFRQFWGEKSELRRFKDGGICEVVVWASNQGLSHKRSVCAHIVSHVLNRHAAIGPDSLQCWGQQLESVLHVPRRILTQTDKDRAKAKQASRSGAAYGTGEERIFTIRQALEELGKTLRRLPDLPLRVNAVTGIDPVFRFAEVFPAHPAVKRMTSKYLLKGDNPLPLFTPAMTVVCSLEGSGHWPEDVDRIRELKTLFLIDMGHKLRQLGHRVTVSPAHLDVLQQGFVFRLKLGVKREVAVLRTVVSPEGMVRMEDTPQALAVDHEIHTLPDTTTLMQGIQQDHPAFSVTVRVIKRWMSAQLLLGHMPELAVERMVAKLFTDPLPFSPPGSPLVGLLRFLTMMSDPECKVEAFCDAVTVAPPPVIVTWWRKVAQQSLQVLRTQPDAQWKVIFRPPQDVYDIIIHLSPDCLARRHHGLDAKDVAVPKYPDAREMPGGAEDAWMPVLDFNIPEKLLEALEEKLGDSALFFHDRYGGDVIAVLFKPESQRVQKMEEENVWGRQLSVHNGEEPAFTLDPEAIVETIHRLGGNNIAKITTRPAFRANPSSA